MGDDLAMLIPLNQDTMDRHVGRMRAGASVLYDRDRVKPGAAAEGVQLCPLPLSELAKNILYYNTAAVAAVLRLVSVELKPFEEMLAEQFKRKGDAVVAENVMAARAGTSTRARTSSRTPSRCRTPASGSRSPPATRASPWAASLPA